jgi:Uma2 family endonuclease
MVMVAAVAKPRRKKKSTSPIRREIDNVLLQLPPGGSAYLDEVSWETYEHLLHLRDVERPGVRLTYDRGELELMTVTYSHESWKTLLTNLVNCFAEETGMVMNPAGNLTVRRKGLLRGLEPDDCFYVQNAAVVMPPRELDFTVDPPPDLAIEVEKSRTVIKRLPIYAALGIPEVWRFNGKMVVVLLRQPTGRYETTLTSRAFPNLDLAAVARHVQMLGETDQMTILRRFRAWVRKKYVR